MYSKLLLAVVTATSSVTAIKEKGWGDVFSAGWEHVAGPALAAVAIAGAGAAASRAKTMWRSGKYKAARIAGSIPLAALQPDEQKNYITQEIKKHEAYLAFLAEKYPEDKARAELTQMELHHDMELQQFVDRLDNSDVNNVYERALEYIKRR